MTQPGYDQQKRECWEEFCKDPHLCDSHSLTKSTFNFAFDRAYTLGKQTETVTQEEVEKAAIEYVLTRHQARHNAKKEEDATMRDFDKTIKAWDAYDMEQAFESGANLFLGKQEKDAEDTVISGWMARDKNGALFMYKDKPSRISPQTIWHGELVIDAELDISLFPNLTWDSDPIEVELIIKRKKTNL